MAARPEADSRKAAPRAASPQGELEQYGVWVKAEPQDIIEEPEAAAEETLDLSPRESAVPEESFLTEEEEELLGSFEELAEESPREEGPVESSALGLEDLPPLEEFDIPTLPETETEKSVRAPLEAEAPDALDATIDISLEDFDRVDEPSPIGPDSHIDMSAVEGLTPPPPSQAAEARENAVPEKTAATSGGFEIEDVSAEFLDLGERPIARSEEPKDITSEFLEEETAPAPLKTEADFEPLDIDLEFNDTIQEGGRDQREEAGFEAVSEFDNVLAAPESSFDDLAAVERDLAEELPAAPGAVAPPQVAPPTRPPLAQTSTGAEAVSLSNDLLSRIAAELSSIRGELVSLKHELGVLKRAAPAAAEVEPPSVEAAPREEKPSVGFFDEEEDETIALTGDELDNILNTADFTEETVADEESLAAPEEEEIILHEEAATPEPLLPESGDYATFEAEPAIEEIHLGSEPETVAEPLEPVAAEAEPVSELIAEGGVLPMTEAPEDTSYLENALTEEAALDFAETPLAEAPLVEPDLSAFETEAEELESALEVSEELPLVETFGETGGEEIGGGVEDTAPETGTESETLEDIALDIPVGSDYYAEPVPEAEVLEPLPEVEASPFGEISLAEESAETPIDESLPVTEELEELGGLESAFGGEEAETPKPAEPIFQNPDEIPTSLDERLFVSAPASGEPATPSEEPECAPETAKALAEFGPAAEMDESLEPPSEKEQTAAQTSRTSADSIDSLKANIRSVLSYLDKLLESLPEDKIEEFARSEHFDTYKKLFEDLGLV